jgi:hypothetical protein
MVAQKVHLVDPLRPSGRKVYYSRNVTLDQGGRVALLEGQHGWIFVCKPVQRVVSFNKASREIG